MIDWRPELRRAVLYVVGHVLNPVVLTLVRRHRFGRFAVLDHYGRRSGRLFSTPVEARSMPGGGIVIPLTWGQQTDWFRNVRAAGTCVVHWRGVTCVLVQPELVEGPAALSAFHPVERVVLRLRRVQMVHFWQASHRASAIDAIKGR